MQVAASTDIAANALGYGEAVKMTGASVAGQKGGLERALDQPDYYLANPIFGQREQVPASAW